MNLTTPTRVNLTEQKTSFILPNMASLPPLKVNKRFAKDLLSIQMILLPFCFLTDSGNRHIAIIAKY